MTQNKRPYISIIIPVFNEEAYISSLLYYLYKYSVPQNVLEILVVDGGSTDATVEVAKKSGVTILTSAKGRAQQMNMGAVYAKGDILYFLHADTLPPKNFDNYLVNAFEMGSKAGCFRLKFDSPSLLLTFFSWFSRFKYLICRGGDQSLYIIRDFFYEIGGFNTEYMVYEDIEFIRRIVRKTTFNILPQHVITSPRKYVRNGFARLQCHYGIIHVKNFFGAGPETLNAYYKRRISE